MKKQTLNGFILCLILCLFLQVNAQSWGTYTLIAPQGSTSVKLIDLNGAAFKTWTLSGNNGYTCLLTPDRYLVRLVGGNGGNGGSRIEKISWDGAVIWTYNISAHHDICVLPNGNVLATVQSSATSAELSELGFTGGTTNVTNSLKYDKIVEIDGVNQTIVWEWRFIDHLIQNVKSSVSNYGVPADNPQLFNIQVRGDNGYNDWQHLNGLDYYPQRDQIVFSCKHLREIFVIDHSTTTAEAASHSGGKSGKGGDFLYRWGYPSNYGKPNTSTNTFGIIHNASWAIGETYQAQNTNPSDESYHAYAGQITVFSNTNVAGMTIIPPYSENSFLFDYTSESAYAPSSYNKKISISGRSTNMGCAQALANGNMIIYGGSGFNTVYERDSIGGSIWSSNTANGCAKLARYSAAYVNGDYAEICANVDIGVLIGNTPIAPSITTETLPDGKVGENYYAILSALGDEPITWSLDNGNLPNGLNLSSNGIISGIPVETETFIFTVKATNEAGSDIKELSIFIEEESLIAPSITTETLPDGIVGANYYAVLSALGDEPITWSLDNGNLPDGLNLSSNGIISGITVETETFIFTVKATNEAGSDIKGFSIFVEKDDDDVIFSLLQIAGLKIFPNPAKDKLIIECENMNQNMIIFYDMVGKEVLCHQINGKTEVNISNLQKGIYIVSIISANEVIGNFKIIKQ